VRDIVNVNDIDHHVSHLVLGRRETIALWLKSVYRNYLLREYPFLIRVVGENCPISMEKLSDKKIETVTISFEGQPLWLIEKLESGKLLYQVDLNSTCLSGITNILDYLQAEFPENLNLSKISYSSARQKSLEWHAAWEAKSRAEQDEKNALVGTVKIDDAGPYSVYHLRTVEALTNESSYMGHCVASYDPNASIILSFRSPSSRFTVDISSSLEEGFTTVHSVNQFKAKFNQELSVEDKTHFYSWLKMRNIQMSKYVELAHDENFINAIMPRIPN
jgi:hypothetical protein